VNPTAVATHGLSVAYRTRTRLGWRRRHADAWALRDVDLTVPPGRSLGVIGANGSGKTTLLQALAGVIRPTAGEVDTQGRVASLVDLSAGFHRDLTGHENLLIGGVLLGLGRAEVRERAEEIVAFSGLPDESLDWPLAAYSAGMGLRLGFSLVVHSDPDVLLVDEVLAVGDEGFQQQCVERVDALQAGGCAVVLVSHDMTLIRDHSDEVAVLDAGRVRLRGAPEEAIADHVADRRRHREMGPGERRLYDPSRRAPAVRRRRPGR
jgi:ABC-type polysaccharide/polyol phosphate transport system ATPase subunit